jgi:hypothetical protein
MKEALYTESLTIALKPEQYRQIKEITDAKRISKADWVRAAVDAALAKGKIEKGHYE